MATLLEDIKLQAEWLTKAFAADKLNLDYSISSLIEIDKFFNSHTKNGNAVKGGRLAENTGSIIFALGSYVGQTIIKAVPGSVWQTDDNDPQAEITASVKLPDGTVMWPMQKVMKRFKNGKDDSIYVYGHYITKEHTGEPFEQSYWDIDKEVNSVEGNKPWWKFW